MNEKSKIPEGAHDLSWWDSGAERYQNINRNPLTAAQRDVLFRTVAALAPGPIGWDVGGPGFTEEAWGIHCKGLNIVNGKDLTCDAMDLPFEDNSVDYIVSSHTVEHVLDVDKAFNEWIRVLKPGGLMAHKVPDFNHFQHDNDNPNHTQPDLAPNEMTADEFLAVLKCIDGLEVLLFNSHLNNFDIDALLRKRRTNE